MLLKTNKHILPIDVVDLKSKFVGVGLKVNVMRRKFSAVGMMHIYQRSISGFNLFYSLEDFLVFYTIVSVTVPKFKISLWEMCLMIDHIHILASCAEPDQLSEFVSAYTSLFVREFNMHLGRSGSLFEGPYGSACKIDQKKIRSAVIYLFNNPVEKKLCTLAEEYRWNFLKYYDPEKTRKIKKKRGLSRKLQRALRMADEAHTNKRYLNYALLKKLMKDIDPQEKELLTDYIITLYFPFDKSISEKYFRSYKDMVTAVNSNTGSEYDIIEKHYGKTDAPYREILQYLRKRGVTDPKSLIIEQDEVKKRYYLMLKENTSARPVQIRKFLHMKKELEF